MKLVVQGIEEIEITDPAGLCNPPRPQPSMPSDPMTAILPGATPFQPQPRIPGTGDVAMPHRPPIYTRHIDDPTKWGVGGEAIQRAGEQDPEKWGKNWKANVKEGKTDGDGNTHQQ